ncbi:DAPG hydrolase family protein [Nocardia anaemiae]|uniref:DAPG hydrolase family protein n=1 Tax=Nocardia anaemiae TaxID=263910 RepID=UPI001FDF86A6|nr:hypothetical protein [Nocardia anaemiae]
MGKQLPALRSQCAPRCRGFARHLWDWWFGWHSVESARYKLWYPDAHMLSEASVDKAAQPMPDRAKYVALTKLREPSSAVLRPTYATCSPAWIWLAI